MYIPILLGTGREGRQSEKVANFMLTQVKASGCESELYDVRDYGSNVTIPYWVENPKADAWKAMVTKADALIIVVPEYNHGYPGELKIVLDSAYDEYDKLPVGLCPVSSGRFGGARVAEHILPVLHEMHFIIVPKPLYFVGVEKFSSDDAKQQERAGEFIERLKDYAALARRSKP